MDKQQKQESEPKADQKRMPTPGDLFRAWKEGGEAKLAEMLPDEPDEEE